MVEWTYIWHLDLQIWQVMSWYISEAGTVDKIMPTHGHHYWC